MATRKPDTYHTARTRILHDILSFCMTHKYKRDDGTFYNAPGINGFIYTRDHRELQIGDLVIIQAAPATKWTIGWYMGSERPDGWCEDRHLIRSLEDQSECWWTNVGLSYLDREHLRPEWRWTDRQFEFNKKWLKHARKAVGYGVVPLYPEFQRTSGQDRADDCYAVTLRMREKWSLHPLPPEQAYPFPDWRKVTVADIKAAARQMEVVIEQMVKDRNERLWAEREVATG